MNPRKKYLPSFGRRRGRHLKLKKRELWEQLLPEIRLQPETHIWQSPEPHMLEIGFGSGEHLAQFAKAHPDTLCIGGEVYENGIATLLSAIDQHDISNIRLFDQDIRLLLENAPKASLSEVHMLFPDPWPKQRHHKRRLLQPPLLEMLEHALTPGGTFFLATDDADYAEWMLVHMAQRRAFTWSDTTIHDFRTPPAYYTPTRYESKTRHGMGREISYITFVRNPN